MEEERDALQEQRPLQVQEQNEKELVDVGFRRHKFLRCLILVTKLHKKMIEREVSQTGVYRSQHQILMYVADHPNVSQKDIALLHHASPATIAVSLKKLEKGGYLVRRMAEEDNRVNQILLTEKGKATVEKSRQMFQRIEEQVLKGISEEEMQQTEAVLKHLFENAMELLPEEEKEGMNW